jgi:hypothetical protein
LGCEEMHVQHGQEASIVSGTTSPSDHKWDDRSQNSTATREVQGVGVFRPFIYQAQQEVLKSDILSAWPGKLAPGILGWSHLIQSFRFFPTLLWGVACEDTVGWVTKEGATCDSVSWRGKTG